MELAGLKTVMDADFSAVFAGIKQAEAAMAEFSKNAQNAFKGIKLENIDPVKTLSTYTRDAAIAARDLAKAKLDEAKALDVADRTAQRAAKSKAKELDEYGQLVAQNQALVRAYYNASAAVIKYGDASGITAEKLEEMRIAALNGQEQLKKIEAGAGRFHRNVGDYSNALNGIRISAQYLTGEIPNFFQSMQIGLRSITNNIQPLILNLQGLREENIRLAASGKPTINILKATVGAFLSWQTALLVGIGVLAKYGPELYEMATGGKAAAEAVKQFAKNQKDLNNAFKSGLTSAASHISAIKALNITITSGNIPMEARVKAYKEAIKQYPSYLSSVSKESALNGGLADVINKKLVPALLSAAKARGFENQLTKLTEQEIELRQGMAESIKTEAKEAIKLLGVQKQLAAKGNNPGPLALGALAGSYDRAATATATYRNEIIKNKKEQAEILELFKKQVQQNDHLDTSGKDFATYREKATKLIKDATTAYQDLITKNKEADADLVSGAATIQETLQKKISNWQNYIKTITKTSKYKVDIDDSRVVEAQKNVANLSVALASVKNDDKIDKVLQNANTAIAEIDQEKADGVITTIKQLTDEINVYANTREALSKLNQNGYNDSFIAYYTNQIKSLNGLLNNEQLKEGARKLQESFKLIDNELSVGFITSADAASEKVQLLRQEMKGLIRVGMEGTEVYKTYQQQLNDFIQDAKNAEFAKYIQGQLQDLVSSFADSVGGILSDPKFDLFGNLISLLGEQLQALGKYMISAGLVLKKVWDAINKLATSGPIGAAASVIAGAAAIAVGQYLSSEAKKRASNLGKTAFAGGGIVYGPTNALVGEYSNARSNPEVIAPLDKLTAILRNQNLGGGMIPVVLETRINGQDLLLIQKRAQSSFNR